jgi:hypothetical protein
MDMGNMKEQRVIPEHWLIRRKTLVLQLQELDFINNLIQPGSRFFSRPLKEEPFDFMVYENLSKGQNSAMSEF